MKHGAALTLLIAVVAVAGCGGGDDDPAAATTPAVTAPLTKAQYIAAADKICKAADAKIAAAAKPLNESSEDTGTLPISKVAKFLTTTTLPTYDAMLEDLRALEPPKEDEKTIDGYIAALAGAIDTTKADPVKYSRIGPPDPFDPANEKAIDYGMNACGS